MDYELSGGNVFADLGLDDADELLPKSELAWRIAERIHALGPTQEQAADELGVDQPRVSAIVRGRLRDFSIERLMHVATRLGLDVDITVSPNEEPTRAARIAVHGVVSARERPTAGSFRRPYPQPSVG